MEGESLRQILLALPQEQNQPRQGWTSGSTGGVQDIYGQPLTYPLCSPTGKKTENIGHPDFNNDPRLGTQAEIQAAGFKLKAGAIGVLGYVVGKSQQDLEDLVLLRKEGDLSLNQFNQQKSSLFTAYYNGNQIESDTRPFAPYHNVFDPPASAAQQTQIAKLEKMAEAMGVSIRHFGESNFYQHETQTIFLPTKEHFRSPEAYMQTLAHELIHATRDKAPQFGPQHLAPSTREGDYPYALEEWRAELGAALILERLGVSTDLTNSAVYIDSWAQPSEGLRQELSVADRSKKIDQSIEAASFVLEKVGQPPISLSAQMRQELKTLNEAHPLAPQHDSGPGRPETLPEEASHHPQTQTVESLFTQLAQAAVSGNREAFAQAVKAVGESPMGEEIRANSQALAETHKEQEAQKEMEKQQQVQEAQVQHKGFSR